MKFNNLFCAGIVLVIVFTCLVFVSGFQGSSASYSSDNKIDSFAEGNANSTSFANRLVGGIANVGKYVALSFSGRWGILGSASVSSSSINFTYPLNDAEIIRGNNAVAGEDDSGVVPDLINLTAKVYDSTNYDLGVSGAVCYFYWDSELIGSSSTNSSGDCLINYSKISESAGIKNLMVNFTDSEHTINLSESQINISLVRYVAGLTMTNQRANGKYYDGDISILEIEISKINSSGTFDYDPQNISVNATNHAENVYASGASFYPGNITKTSAGSYTTNVTVNYGFGAFVRWDFWMSDTGFVDYLGSAIHADEDICSGDFGAWGDWGACSGGTQTRTRSDASGCSEVESQSCTTSTSCFPAGTKILMDDRSEKDIEKVRVGDYVMGYDLINDRKVTGKVLELEFPIREHMCELIFVDGSALELTNEHPVYTRKGWKSIEPFETARENSELVVEKLGVGDEVLFSNYFYKVVLDINCWEEVVQTYNLKSILGSNNFYADNVLVHNKGCTPHWTIWSNWSDCINEQITRTRTDGCGNTETEFAPCDFEICDDGVDNDGDGLVDCDDPDCIGDPACECVPDWSCSWTNCELDIKTGIYYSFPYNCVDSNLCGSGDGKPDKVDCGEDRCFPLWECGEWDECSVDYDWKDILRGKISLQGKQSRFCEDFRDCENETVQWQECELASPVRIVRTNWCFEDYLEIYEIASNKLVARVKENSISGIMKLDFNFIVADFAGYCDYCYDGVLNYDEEEVDCGGSMCPECVSRRNFVDYCHIIKLILWLLLLLLLVYLIYKNWDEIKPIIFKSNKKIKRKKTVVHNWNRFRGLRLLPIEIIIKIRKVRHEKRRNFVNINPVKKFRKVPKKYIILPYANLRKMMKEWKAKTYFNTAKLEEKLIKAITLKISQSKKYRITKHQEKIRNNKLQLRKKSQQNLLISQEKSREKHRKKREIEKKKIRNLENKILKKEFKKSKKSVKRKIKIIKRNIRNKKRSTKEIVDLRKKLQEWKKLGYTNTILLQKKLDKLEGYDLLRGRNERIKKKNN
ncbi:MAG: hypothetical protein U9Q06_02375 [Nanoarchaeota archaeon]|nr:hypothetical protein [Nanoarchaeota archaeon]